MTGVVRRRVDFEELRMFWAVAQSGSFGAAARALGVSPSTLTRAVENLEGRLNARLLVRHPHGVTLTEAGRKAYDKVLTMERAATALEAELLGADKAASGRVKLSAPDGVAGFMLAPHMPAFLSANPDIDLVVDCGLWPDRPLDGDADMTLTFTEPTQADAVSAPIAYLHYGLFGSSKYFDLYGEPSTTAETLAHRYVHHAAQTHQRSETSAAFQRIAQMRLQTNSSAVSFLAIINGAGVGPLPTFALTIEPSLRMVPLPPMPAVTLWLVHAREVGRAARVQRVIAWLGDVFDQRTKPWFRQEYVRPEDFEREVAAYRSAEPQGRADRSAGAHRDALQVC